MPEITRITVGKNDEATVVAEQLIDADNDTIIFSIPRGSVFSQSLNNFKLLKREGDVLGKEIIIESEDTVVRERAVKAGLEIGEAAPAAAEESVADVSAPRGAAARLPRGRNLRVKTASDERESEPVSRIARPKKKAPVDAEDIVDAEIEAALGDEPTRGEPVRPTRAKTGDFWRPRRVVQTIAAAAVAAGLFYVALFVLPTATVTVTAKKDAWGFKGTIMVDKSLVKIDAANAKIPGQVFTQKNTGVVRLPASGKRFVERKATGVITIYNAYSSQPQNIVANTRFVTPSGVVFRIVKAITIPGAKIENSQIQPSSITAEVIADKAGTLGNVGPVPRLTIPGFAKTPKAQGFYGELKEGTTGGFAGETRVATDTDIKAAKASGAKAAEELVRAQIAGQVPTGFKTIESATRFSIIKQVVDAIADESGVFTVTTEAQLSVFAFREQDVRDVLTLRRETEKAEYKVDTEQLSYGTAGENLLVSGKIALPVTYQSTLSYKIDTDALRAKVAGQAEERLSTTVLETPGVTGGNVDLWPFYVRSVPTNTDKITLVVQ
jgi:hypothetical protein